MKSTLLGENEAENQELVKAASELPLQEKRESPERRTSQWTMIMIRLRQNTSAVYAEKSVLF